MMWLFAWLVYVCLMVASGVYQTDFVMHSHWEYVKWIPPVEEILTIGFWFDLAINVLLYIPFAFFFLQWRKTVSRRTEMLVLLLGLLLSCGIELYQVYSHNRRAAPSDIVCNVVGTWVGVQISSRRRRRVKLAEQRVSRGYSQPVGS
jgi:glycopeptide antibiotics resistance protein